MIEVKLGKAKAAVATNIQVSNLGVRATVAFYGDDGVLFVLPDRPIASPRVMRAVEELSAAIEEYAVEVTGAVPPPAEPPPDPIPGGGLLIQKSGKEESLQDYFEGFEGGSR